MVEHQNESMHSGKVWLPLRMQDIAPETNNLITNVIDKIPDLPLSVSKIIDMTADDESNLQGLVQLASSDPALVSNILKVVNSSYYGLRNKTDNLHLAIVLLGYREIRQIAMQCFLRRSFGGSAEKKAYTIELWEHSYMVSVLAESLVSEDDQQRRGVYLTLGLMHDIGKFVLFDLAAMTQNTDSSHTGHSTQATDQFLLAKEEHMYGVNHTMVGALLAEKWNLSERFVSVLTNHHAPSFYGINDLPAGYIEEISSICIADLLVHQYFGKGNRLPEPHPHFFDIIGLEPPLENLLTEERVNLLDKAHLYITELR